MKKSKLSRKTIILIAVDALILVGVIVLAIVTLSRNDNEKEKPGENTEQIASEPEKEAKAPDGEEVTTTPEAREAEGETNPKAGDEGTTDPGEEGKTDPENEPGKPGEEGGETAEPEGEDPEDPGSEPGKPEGEGSADPESDPAKPDSEGNTDPEGGKEDPDGGEQGENVKTETGDPYEGLDGLSGKKEEWCFQRKKDHSPSGTYEPFAINKYDAYYLNPNVKEGDKVIYFSFDCGYENGYTPKILDTLKKHGVKATFFVTQQFLDSDADLAKRMKEEGHLVGNHTVHHPSLPEKSAEEVVKEVRGVEESFREKTGYELDKFIRPPMGHYSEKVLKELQNMGYITIFWSIAYGDYDIDNQPGKQYVIDHFRQYHHNGAITLTHTVSESNAKALDQVLTDLEAEGYRFGSLEELKH